MNIPLIISVNLKKVQLSVKGGWDIYNTTTTTIIFKLTLTLFSIDISKLNQYGSFAFPKIYDSFTNRVTSY